MLAPNRLDDVLVISVRKSFWASPECEIFPHRLYATQIYGYSQNRLNSALTLLRSLVAVAIRRPRLILFGSSHRLVPWFVRLKQRGWFANTRLVATNQVHFSDAQARLIDRIIVYSSCEAERHDAAIRDRYVFMPLPLDVPIDRSAGSSYGDYVFSGGGPGPSRDFKSLIEAVRHLPVTLVIVTFSPESLGYDGDLPPNVQVHWRMPIRRFVEIMAGSLLVVVPLHDEPSARGHTTVVQALALGKPVITTIGGSLDDYVRDGREGFLVAPGDVEGYRAAILRLLSSQELTQRVRQGAMAMGNECTYEAAAGRIVAICREALSSGRSEAPAAQSRRAQR